MATTYKKDGRNVYVIPLYARFWVWWFVISLIALFIAISWYYLHLFWLLLLMVVIWSLVAILAVWKAYMLIKKIIEAESFQKYISQARAEKSITKSLLATMAVNRLQDTPFISVPKVTVCDNRPSHLNISIEKLAGMYDVEHMTEDINASLRGALSDYAVTSSIISDDGLNYNFVAEDVATDKTFRPATIKDLQMKSHEIKLQEGLTINLSDRPHLIIWGKSGSGKTTLLLSIISQLLSNGTDLRFIDGKTEFSSFSEFYPSEKIVNDVDATLSMLADICDLIKERQKIVADGVSERQKMGLRAYDLGLKPVVVLADEIGSVVAGMDSKQKKAFMAYFTQIVQKGRSVSVFAIVATQSPKTDTTLSSDIRSQFATKILLGSANGDYQRMAFDGEVATKGDVAKFRGYYMSDGLTKQPMTFFVPDLHSNNMNDLSIFKKIYG